MSQGLTLNEAGYVVGRTSAAIGRAMDRGIIPTKVQQRGHGRIRKIGPAELRYLAIAEEIEKDLTPAGRRKVYEAVRKLPIDIDRLHLGLLELKLTEIDRRIADRLRRLRKIKSLVDDTGKDAILKDSGVPVHALAALAKNHDATEVEAAYPSLTQEQIDAAIDYAKVYPRAGRPLPDASLKRMLAEAAAAGVWEVASDEEPITPRPIP